MAHPEFQRTSPEDMKPLNFNRRRQIWVIECKTPGGRWVADIGGHNGRLEDVSGRLFRYRKTVPKDQQIPMRIIRYLPQGTKG